MLFFLSSYLWLALKGRPGEQSRRLTVGALAVAVGSCAHRVATGKHTVAQVAVGALTGTLGGGGWWLTGGSNVSMTFVDGALGAFRASGAAWAEWPLLLGCQAAGLFFLTGGGRRLSMRGGSGMERSRGKEH